MLLALACWAWGLNRCLRLRRKRGASSGEVGSITGGHLSAATSTVSLHPARLPGVTGFAVTRGEIKSIRRDVSHKQVGTRHMSTPPCLANEG